MQTTPPAVEIVSITPSCRRKRYAAMELLTRFFREEGFRTPPERIRENLDRMLADPSCWAAIALAAEQPIGVVTVTTMLYLEWGRLPEIGQLYFLPRHPGRGRARGVVA